MHPFFYTDMIINLVKEIRIRHWLKNIFIFAPLIFTPERWSLINLFDSIIGLIAFSLIASAVYILNDLYDADEDRRSPINIKRPFASGVIDKKTMYISFVALFIFGFAIALFLNVNLFIIIVAYLVLNIFYTYFLKRYRYINYSTIALGFVLRILGGCAIISVRPSIWIVVMTFILAYYISIVKFYINGKKIKFDEIQIKVLSIVIPIVYLFYTINGKTIKHFGTNLFFISIFPVIAGFIYTVYKIQKEYEKDIVSFFTDKIYWSIYILWLMTIINIIGKRYY